MSTYVLPTIGGDLGLWGAEVNNILTSLDSRATTLETAAGATLATYDARYGKILNAHLIAWFVTGAWTHTTGTYDGSNRLTAASIVWPDGSTGTYAATTLNNTLGTVDAWTCTYVNASFSKTVTQPTLTRDGNANITVRPIVTVT